MDARKQVGMAGERLALDYLKEKSYKILYAPWKKLPYGEIDIVAEKGGQLVFVEVKLRRSSRYGNAAEAVHAAKRYKLSRLISFFLSAHRLGRALYRLDVIAIDAVGDRWQLRHIEGVGLDG